MKKTIEVIRKLPDTKIIDWLNNFIDNYYCSLALSKECRDYLANRGIYWPYKKLSDELE